MTKKQKKIISILLIDRDTITPDAFYNLLSKFSLSDILTAYLYIENFEDNK